MPALPTNGFSLSALPIALQFPTNIGDFDSARAAKALSDQVELSRRLANYTAQQKANQAKLGLEAAMDTAALGNVPAEAADKAASLDASTRASKVKSSVLADAAPNLIRSGVLSAQAGVGGQEAVLAQQGDIKELRARSKSELADVQKRFQNAGQLADHDAEANELEAIERDYPWIGQLPEYKTQHDQLKAHILAARQRALDLQKSTAAQTRAETIANTGLKGKEIAAKATVDSANVRAGGRPDEFERETNNFQKFTQLATEAEDPDDRAMYEQRAAISKGRMDNLNTAKAVPGALQMQKARLGAQHALDATEANADRMSTLIDNILPRVTRTGGAGIGSILSVIPESDARTLKSDIETLKANIGFNELNTLRQQSPTGGALGQVTERELHFLQNVIASLDTSLAPDVLRANLVKARGEIQGSAQRLREAYQRDFGAAQAPLGGATASPTQFETGKVYTDASGNKATYLGNGQWKEVR